MKTVCQFITIDPDTRRHVPVELPTPQARRAIEDEIDFYSARILHLRKTFNTLAPIAVLPPETLCAIFSHATDIASRDASNKAAACYSMISISHVCKHWREVALGCPILWSTLHFDAMPPQCIAEFLRRSQEVPLAISWVIQDSKLSASRPTATSGETAGWGQGGIQPSNSSPSRPMSASGVKESLALARALQSQLWRVRSLSLRLKYGGENEILRELDVPAPLLESLAIHCMKLTNATSEARDNVFRLLHHPVSGKMRRLELTCLPIRWFQVTLPHLTHLTITGRLHFDPGSHTDVGVLLSAIARMPMLEDLAVVKTLAASSEAVPSTDSNQITLPHLHSLRVEENVFHCSRFLNDLAMPSLCHLNLIDMWGNEDISPVDVSRVASAMMERAASLGSFGTVTIDLGLRTKHAFICAYSDVYDVAAIDKLHRVDNKPDNTCLPAFSMRFKYSDESGRWLDSNTIVDLCRLLPLGNVRTLLVAGRNIFEEMWRVLARKANNIECLSVCYGMTKELLPEVLMPPPTRPLDSSEDGGSHERPCVLPRLRHLALADCRFSRQRRGGRGSFGVAEETLVDCLIGCLTSRAEKGAGIQCLHIIRPINLLDKEVELLKKTVDDLEWDRTVSATDGAIPGTGPYWMTADHWDAEGAGWAPHGHWGGWGEAVAWGTEGGAVADHWDTEDIGNWGPDEEFELDSDEQYEAEGQVDLPELWGDEADDSEAEEGYDSEVSDD